MNRTPLRLVAIEESPPAEDEPILLEEDEESSTAESQQSGAPVAMMNEQDAITRKVPESEMYASMNTAPDKPTRFPRSRILLPAGVVAVAVVVVVVALSAKRNRTATTAPVKSVASQVPSLTESQEGQPAAAPTAPTVDVSPRAKAVPEIIRLGITAEPMETELSLDGNMLAGHRLNVEVPKDRGIHIVSASAPGYIPFNQQVSFSSDVLLKISLRRAHTPPVRQAAKPLAAPHESGTKSIVRPAAASSSPGVAPGMNLEGPSMRPNAKPIDERNPYKP